MSLGLYFILLLALTVTAYALGRGRAMRTASGDARKLHSLPSYYGWFAVVFCLLPALVIITLWLAIGPAIIDRLILGRLPTDLSGLSPGEVRLLLNDIKNIASGDAISRQREPVLIEAGRLYGALHAKGLLAAAVLSLALGAGGTLLALRVITPDFRARPKVERVVRVVLIASSAIAVLTTVGIVLSLVFESLRFFERVPVSEFLFGLNWSPQTALRADQVGSSGAFGAVPLFAGTLLITLVAMLVAVPIGLMSAVYMTQYAGPRLRKIAKPVLEILAGIPTVVYGFFAALVVAPFFREFGESLGLDVASESALAAGVVMGIMIIPFVSSLSDDAITAVPRAMRDGSFALGATKSETIRKVVIPAALPGVVGAFLLAVSRAVGETMIVVMAAGLAANLTANPLDAVTTVTAQIVALLTGDQEFDSAKTLSAFALGLVLFVVTLGLNVIALGVVRKYRETYE
ncbi:MAG: phosphate ABC transporter permease subunit PstC [Alphaproteobacteria bacterium]|nr:MAG: phosphate ABC transporter permease subunit PstC [Alphaproteobacteria bacterium]